MTTAHESRRLHILRAGPLVGVLGLAAGLFVAACGDDDDAEPAGTESGAGIVVADAWARSSPTLATAGAAYMMITNTGGGDDALVSVEVADTVAARAELHETRAAGADGMGDTATTMSAPGGGASSTTPMMEMVPVDRIDVPAGGAALLEPGGLHIMLLELVEPLEEGDDVELTLSFEVAGEMVVTAVVGDGAP